MTTVAVGQECHEAVTRDDKLQPCERPAVGYRFGSEGGFYPVCRKHFRPPYYCPPMRFLTGGLS